MRRGHGQLYRREFEPIAQIGDIVVLRTGDGFVTDDADTPFYVITHVESSPLMGQKGTVVIWSHTDAPAAPYLPDKLSQIGVNLGLDIGAGQTLTFQPDFLNLQKRQVMQFRALVRAVPDSDGDALTGCIDDYDISFNIGSAQQRWGTQRLIGVLNAVQQGTLPSDVIAAPAQGTNFTGTTNTQRDPFELAARTELFVYGSDPGNGQIGIKNNGAAGTSDGAIGLQMADFLFNIYPLDGAGAIKASYLGYDVPVPAGVNLEDVICMPVQAQTTPKSKGS